MVDPAKVEAVMRWKVLRSLSEIQIFLGLVGYYLRFIQDFSKIAVPLTRLIKKVVVFRWGPEQQTAFDFEAEVVRGSDLSPAMRALRIF